MLLKYLVEGLCLGENCGMESGCCGGEEGVRSAVVELHEGDANGKDIAD